MLWPHFFFSSGFTPQGPAHHLPSPGHAAQSCRKKSEETAASTKYLKSIFLLLIRAIALCLLTTAALWPKLLLPGLPHLLPGFTQALPASSQLYPLVLPSVIWSTRDTCSSPCSEKDILQSHHHILSLYLVPQCKFLDLAFLLYPVTIWLSWSEPLFRPLLFGAER